MAQQEAFLFAPGMANVVFFSLGVLITSEEELPYLERHIMTKNHPLIQQTHTHSERHTARHIKL